MLIGMLQHVRTRCVQSRFALRMYRFKTDQGYEIQSLQGHKKGSPCPVKVRKPACVNSKRSPLEAVWMAVAWCRLKKAASSLAFFWFFEML